MVFWSDGRGRGTCLVFSFSLPFDLSDSLFLLLQILLSFSKLRVSNHKLETELGRYRNIPSKERYCRVCKSNQIEDEFHFIMCVEYTMN